MVESITKIHNPVLEPRPPTPCYHSVFIQHGQTFTMRFIVFIVIVVSVKALAQTCSLLDFFKVHSKVLLVLSYRIYTAKTSEVHVV